MSFNLLVLDTNFYSALARNDPRVRPFLYASLEVAIPHTVIGELIGGFRYGSQFGRNYNDLQRILAKPTCRILMPTMETANIYGRLYADLRRRGKMIPTNDIWIAALTIEYEGTIATYDDDFDVIPDLRRAS